MKFLILSLLTIFLAGTAGFGQIIVQPSNNDDAQRAQARRAAVQAAQGEVDRAQAMLEAANARIRANWKASPDLLAADRDLTIKQAAFDRARKPVLDKLAESDAYQSALAQSKTADAQVKMNQAAGKLATGATTKPSLLPATLPAPTEAQVQAATDKLEQRSALREMETKAIAADPAATQAQVELDAAREKIKMLNLQFDAAKLNDPEYKSALNQLNSAKSRLTAAGGQY